ncbi:PHP domain-containing protein [Escherichia coli]|nr:PHP domain-containing protein [Escherichia coli]
MSEPRFVHLRVHSDYSMIDGLAKTAPLVKKAAALGMPALAAPSSPPLGVWATIFQRRG